MFALWIGSGQADSQLRIATDGTFPPFSYRDSEGRFTGFDVDMAMALCGELKEECEIIGVPFSGILDGLEQNRYDMVVSSMSLTPEREARATFTKRYYQSRDIFIGRGDSVNMTLSRDSLAGKVLLCMRGTVQEDYLRKHFDDVATIVATPSLPEATQLMAQGKGDLLLTDTLTGYNYLRSDSGAALDVVGLPPDSDGKSGAVYIQVHKGNFALRDRINAALDRLRLSGVYHKINQKYFPFSIY